LAGGVFETSDLNPMQTLKMREHCGQTMVKKGVFTLAVSTFFEGCILNLKRILITIENMSHCGM